MDKPELPPLPPRTAEILTVARTFLERHGWEALTMRTLAEQLGIKAPSLYKHIANKDELRVLILVAGFGDLGSALRSATAHDPSPRALLRAYRKAVTAQPHHYRLATSGELPRAQLPPGLEDWAGAPFAQVVGDPVAAQLLFATAHGLAILEIDQRLPPGSDLDGLWELAARQAIVQRTG